MQAEKMMSHDVIDNKFPFILFKQLQTIYGEHKRKQFVNKKGFEITDYAIKSCIIP